MSGHNINYRDKVDVVVSTGGDASNLESVEAVPLKPLTRPGDYEARVSLNAVLSMSTSEQIVYIREAGED
jgi:hypothetical protein